MGKVAVVGHLCVDIRPQLAQPPTLEPGTLRQVGPVTIALGGAVANTGRVLVVLGVPVVGWGAVGDDDLGAIITAHLGRIPGFEFRPQMVAVGSSYTIVLESPQVDRAFWHYPGSNAALDLGAVSLDGIDLLHFGYPSLLPGVCADSGAALVDLFTRANRAGIATSLDLAWVDPRSNAGDVDWPSFLERILPVTDVLSPSHDDLACIFDLPETFGTEAVSPLVERLLGLGAGIVMVTGGAEGIALGAGDSARLARLATRGLRPDDWAGVRLDAPARALTQVSTTTGAGDAATAGLLAGVLSGLGPQAAVARAVDVAAAVIQQGGTEAFTFG
ncbi:MAG TPA: carbohydrate kinase family protein [Propionicimonas sp.]